jgi:hypothetical protein
LPAGALDTTEVSYLTTATVRRSVGREETTVPDLTACVCFGIYSVRLS